MEISSEAATALKADAGITGIAATYGDIWRHGNGVLRGEAWSLPNGCRIRSVTDERGSRWTYHLDSPDEVFAEQHEPTAHGYLTGYRPSEAKRYQASQVRQYAAAIRNRAEVQAFKVDQQAEALEAEAERTRVEGAANSSAAYAARI